MTVTEICDSVQFMARKKRGEGEITAQETIRFDDENERLRLNLVLGDVRRNTDGDVTKVRFFKTLMGLQGYSLQKLTQYHRDLLTGKIELKHPKWGGSK